MLNINRITKERKKQEMEVIHLQALTTYKRFPSSNLQESFLDIPVFILEGFELELSFDGWIRPSHGRIPRIINFISIERSQ